MRLEGLRHVAGFRDILTDRKANALLSDFVARKIRQRVKDPAVAEKLIPTNHGFGTRRVPLETKYLEVYIQPNVSLVDIWSTPIERITPSGLRAARTTNSTSSSTPPASTPSPAASTASTSAAPTASS